MAFLKDYMMQDKNMTSNLIENDLNPDVNVHEEVDKVQVHQSLKKQKKI